MLEGLTLRNTCVKGVMLAVWWMHKKAFICFNGKGVFSKLSDCPFKRKVLRNRVGGINPEERSKRDFFHLQSQKMTVNRARSGENGSVKTRWREVTSASRLSLSFCFLSGRSEEEDGSQLWLESGGAGWLGEVAWGRTERWRDGRGGILLYHLNSNSSFLCFGV